MVYRRAFLRVKLEKMPHDKFNGGFVDVVVFATIGEMGQPAEGLIYGGHLIRRKIKYIIMARDEFVSRCSQGRLGVAAGADNIQIPTESGPQVNR